ncbi:MAG: hypothetical protein L0Z50_25875 [Verrucomicrobiales bacterium]|nr:hypothetical protein [Verrucomicrobiales bacterium]
MTRGLARRFALAMLLSTSAVPLVSFAQSGANQINPGNSTGTLPYNLFGGTRENINLSNGNLNLQIPLLTLPGRKGHDLSLALTYDSKIWQLHHEVDEFFGGYWYWDWEHRLASVGTVGWRVNIPSLWGGATVVIQGPQPKYCTTFILTLGDGSKYSFTTQINCFHFGAQGNIVWDPQLDIKVGASQDASFMTLDANNAADVVLRMNDGTRIHFTSPGGHSLSPPSKIVDANGNKITFATITQGVNITDTAGRIVTVNYACPGGITYKDSNGQTRSISWACSTQNFSPPITVPTPAPSGSANLLTSITIPNGLSDTFQYNNTPEVTKITYPTGAYTRYAYGGYQHWWEMWGSGGSSIASFRQLTGRHVCPSSSGTCATEETTTYSPAVDNTKSNNQHTDVRDPLGNRTRHQFPFRTSSQPGSKYFSTRETWRWVYQGESTLLCTVQTEYNALDTYGNPTNSSLPIRVTTNLNDCNQVRKKEWDYGSYGNVSEQREYDYGVGAAGGLDRRTVSTWVGVNPANGQNYTANGIHIRDRKASEAIYDGAGALKAQTQWEYDSYAEGIEASGAVQHESSFGTSYTTRGNLTAVKRWRNLDGAWLETRNLRFDDAGNVLKTRDPGLHITQLSYADSWGNTTCQPTGGSAKAYLTGVTNALGHVTTSAYNSCSGTVASTTDPNSQTTTFSYDLMNRLTQTNLPGGGQSTRAYNEAGVPLSLSTTTKMEYDALGRKKRTYNPTRCNPVETNCGEATWGYADFEYDALGRPTKVVPPDGTTGANNVTTSYSGNTVTVTDQAGKKRKSETDALGRLVRVWEPDATQNLVHITFHQYDVLDNLLCVHQKSTDATADKACGDAAVPAAWRERRYTYNSLSQILTAYNPESGTITYAYDNDGNLTTKTDARSITTTHAYDALHRLTQKSYNDGTPTATLYYDTGSGYQVNMVGRLSRSCWEGTYVNCDWFGYDPMGRVARHEQGGGLWPSALYTYNLAGNVSDLGYYEYYAGRPTRWIRYSYDAAGRVNRMEETGPAQKVHAENILYDPHGAWTSMTLSNGAMQQTASYNSRLQPTSKTVTTVSPASAVMSFTYTFADAQARNNGNVVSMSDNVQVLNYGFQYDELNRLARAETTNSSLWGNTYSYDVWGNLYQKNQIAGKQQGEYFQQTMNTNNQFVGWSYDAAGNLLNDGAHNYQYDPEGRIKCMDAGANCASPAASYMYSIEGRRVKRTVGTAATLHLHDGGSVLSEFSNPGQGVGAWQKDYIYLNGALLATESATDGTRYHFSDHLGTPRVVTDAAGNVISRHDYYPYGKEITAWADGETHKFTGKERDPESNLDYFGARYYSSQQGRFQSPDEFTGGPVDAFSANDPLPPGPLPYAIITNPQSLNKYSYTWNNPLRYTDPDGHSPCPPACAPEIVIELTMRVVPYAEVAGQRLASGGGALFGFTTRILGGAIGFLATPQPTISGSEEQKLIEQHKQQQQSQDDQNQAQPEPQPSAEGAGDRQGGAGRTPHGEKRASQADRGVGDANRVIRDGRKFRDTETGNTVHVKGNRVVITNSKGDIMTQFRNTRRNTQQRIKNGKWEPIAQ